jgi:hypothetical protein
VISRKIAQFALAGLLLGTLAPGAGAAEFRLLRLDGVEVKWGAPDLGSGAEVSYGFTATSARFPDAINCGTLAPMTEMASVWGGDRTRLEKIARAAFDMWSRAADLTFRPAMASEAPDILIGVQAEPRGTAFANVWHGAGADGIAPLTRATICFNPEEAWTTDGGPSAAGVYDIGTVLAHEIGHAIGLDHPGARGALMGYSNQGDIDALMAGDIAGARLLYGPKD